MTDIKRFCAEDTAKLSVETTFEIYDGLFLADTSYPNLSLLDKRTNNPPQSPGPSFWHEETYRRFAAEMVIAEPSIANVQKVGHDLDKTIAKDAWDFFSNQIFLDSIFLIYQFQLSSLPYVFTGKMK